MEIRNSVITQFKRFFVQDQWHIGLMHCESAKCIRTWGTPRGVSWLPQARGRYRADPFVITYQKRTVLFYEEYVFAKDSGHIVCREIFEDIEGTVTYGDPTTIDGPRLHRSYPFVFEDDGELWMIPEESACGNVMLYRCTTFPHKWEPVQELVADFPGVDPTLIMRDNTYWLFATRADDPNKTLYAFFADQLTGPWYPHKNVPLYTNDETIRPAGRPFVIDGTVYRPAQDSRKTYGGSIVLYRIDTLTRHSFREHRVTDITPWTQAMRGLHTISYDEKSHLCAFDIKTRACLNDVLAKTWAKITKRIRYHFVPVTFL